MEFENDEVLTSETEVEGNTINVTVVMPSPEPGVSDPEPVEVLPDLEENPAVVYQSSTLLDAQERDEDSSLAVVVQSLFGEYVPRTQTVTTTGSDGSQVTYTEYVPGLAGLDWYWLAGACFFGICLVSFFKIVGAVIKR